MTSINLPEDLAVEILSKVPAISLARLRSTSKEWNTLIKDGRLAKKHSANAPKQSLVILVINFRICLLSVNLCGVGNNIAPSVKVTSQFSLKDPLSNSSEEVDIRSVYHCQGLLLCRTNDNRRVVWNPCSGETMWIQPRNSSKYPDYYTIGYDNKSFCYKILRLYRFGDGIPYQTEYEVYNFTSNSWKSFHETGVWSFSKICCRFVSVNGNSYWISFLEGGEIVLLSFDFSTEKLRSVSLPPEDNINHSDLALSVTGEGNQLCMLATHVSEFTVTNIWIGTKSEGTVEMLWSKFLTVSRSDIPYRCQFRDNISFLVNQENKLVLSCNRPCSFSKNIIHIVGEEKYIQVYQLGAEITEISPCPVLLGYVPSLVQIQ